ncbi:2-deoxy-D-gluconate 3-dehydrogenase [Herbaspirillum sp. BH-1]|uniref:NAD(P)-dependent dehydrogenase (Short-subunit alcohol dehydrogenase family) n=1 Tax=Herbaspirillum frisingense TaxID=92645 RepID=A0ABU1PII1_9BURK|nr:MULTISPECIES: SDR family oxidoreductase [Herbaspirillum]MDR6584943.1 NAD(P)-dependent dehydrogenase (short-subunit alcohol dehydrogenase family) [Herbaspirillum frisingense]PLY60798.1 2-deoxy-D-gluconate 3-dehydrogenase [Herbaspirillum sp. BH-1]
MSFIPDLLQGKTALVTGGTQGIGGAVARQLAALGARVVAAGLPPFAHEEFTGTDITLVEMNVASEESVRAALAGLKQLDIVVNCAGIIKRGAELETEVFEQVIAVNLTGTMRVCAASRELLRQSGGCIVNTASMLSFFGGGLVPGYSASKGGVAQLTKSLAIAYAADGIRVNAVAPGWIATPLTQALQDDPTRAGPILARTPLNRWGRPEDIGNVVAFLCSPAASFMTGTIIPVDGGYLIA